MKPGWKTSEGLLALAAIILGALVAAGVFPEGSLVGKIAGATVIALASLGYSLSRGMAKANHKEVPRAEEIPGMGDQVEPDQPAGASEDSGEEDEIGDGG